MIKNTICQAILETPNDQFKIVGRDKESGKANVLVTIGRLEVAITTYNRVAICVGVRVPVGSDPTDTERFIVAADYEKSITDKVNEVCSAEQIRNLEKLWAAKQIN